MVCIDTNFLIGLDRGDKVAFGKMQELDDKGEPIYTTVVTAAEYLRGASGARDRTKALRDARDMIKRFSILNLEYDSAEIWGELAQKLKSETIGDRDLFIASIAIAKKQTLVTRNLKHFEKVPDLTVESW